MFILNKHILLKFNSDIVEWDIKAGNISMIKEFNLLPEKYIKKIEPMKDMERKEYVGNLMRKNKVFAKELEQKFNDTVKMFISINGINEEDIISIKRDAIFLINKTIKNPTIGKHIKFINKNQYHAYIYLKPFEIYVGTDNIDVKGINDNVLHLHENGMLCMFHDVISLLEKYFSTRNRSRIDRYLNDFIKAYKMKHLPVEFYREFNSISKYVYHIMEDKVYFDELEEYMKDDMNIEYNYINIILPLVRLIL